MFVVCVRVCARACTRMHVRACLYIHVTFSSCYYVFSSLFLFKLVFYRLFAFVATASKKEVNQERQNFIILTLTSDPSTKVAEDSTS